MLTLVGDACVRACDVVRLVVGDFPMEGVEMIDYLHSIGAKVHYWVVNDARYMQRLLAKGDTPLGARFVPLDLTHERNVLLTITLFSQASTGSSPIDPTSRTRSGSRWATQCPLVLMIRSRTTTFKVCHASPRQRTRAYTRPPPRHRHGTTNRR
jgi:hypothetical protein